MLVSVRVYDYNNKIMIRKKRLLCFKFQIIDSSSFWGQLHENIKPDKDALIKLLIKSRADSTVKRYSSEISKYQKWCNAHSIVAKFPVDTPTAVTYTYSRFLQSHSPSATVSAARRAKMVTFIYVYKRSQSVRPPNLS